MQLKPEKRDLLPLQLCYADAQVHGMRFLPWENPSLP